jgi:hypothetical protein
VGLVILAVVGVVAVIFVVVLFTSARGGGAAGPGARTHLTGDGFFITGMFEPGAVVAYSALVNGTWRNGTATMSGARTFVYTGATPTEVRILGTDDPGRMIVSAPDSGPASSDGGAFDGFPSAY